MELVNPSRDIRVISSPQNRDQVSDIAANLNEKGPTPLYIAPFDPYQPQKIVLNYHK